MTTSVFETFLLIVLFNDANVRRANVGSVFKKHVSFSISRLLNQYSSCFAESNVLVISSCKTTTLWQYLLGLIFLCLAEFKIKSIEYILINL